MRTLLLLLLAASVACQRWSQVDGAPADLVGGYAGRARIIVSWVEQEHLEVRLEVDADGRVTGTVGDAALVDGYLSRNRTRVGRALGLATDWIVIGELDGPLIAAEGVAREGVKIPIDLVEGRLEGGLHSTGAKIGDADTMILSATDLVLRRTD